MKERNAFRLTLIGLLWVVIAVVDAVMMYQNTARVVHLLSFGLASLLAGMFFGQAIQKIRSGRTETKSA